ncbi:type II 3-dehydroquinate dehydratase [Caldicellulosiruptoraceae bacterium PP1]
MKVLVINGPNLNLLGKRETGVYGNKSYDDLLRQIKQKASELSIMVDFYQSNHEGQIIDKLHEAQDIYDGIVINPGAFTHYSYAIHDAIKAINIPVVEVHISNIHQREEFRHKSVTAPACIGQISGFGFNSYVLGLYALQEHVIRKG